ncbi:CBS domain-containing protein [Aliivibrio finisterrensis]|uniref:CBS domain-containing protein n=1 Tax=Aliivibrio finisterrensis TaxID=511998 RepID=A0A4Q5KN98_9GAMM|nr:MULTISPECIES: CBS domain-containing protein [Aliivibrio]MDD9174274.1 CBS domain-containing protein [Aliivibrio sp. S3TY1]MDD9191351.1 CBS domain-containing protein [Aliivibrio sp. S2TY2]RYU47963.1 CBS domain-containing protein [Aliivibrio finisterrensis]RYU70412.1 CBS domain-containing protein [Aliivibrio finisterrensis]RYU74274.1 CBS domain-containing protein [Aliivibrio finisterrensis]
MNKVKVENVMSNTYVMVDGLMTVAEGIQLAKQKQVKALIVKKRHDDDEYGIVLMNDIAKKVLAQNRPTERTNIYEIMTKPALSVSPDMNVKYCARLFERFGISRAPVIKHGEIVGMVSYNNIVLNGMAELSH